MLVVAKWQCSIAHGRGTGPPTRLLPFAAVEVAMCQVPGLIETIKPRRAKHGGTVQVPGRAPKASRPDGDRREDGRGTRLRVGGPDGWPARHSPGHAPGWVTQAEVDEGSRPGTTTTESTRVAELERQVRELAPSGGRDIAVDVSFSRGRTLTAL